ncbi:MAG: hypothetical protein KAY32_08855 [Candidatus Eisenbacteria sp.]|nr:hypothetical protein [Candidatus Eisenbacteria bacterium]
MAEEGSNVGKWRVSLAVLAVLLVLGGSACTKRIPVEDGTFDAMDSFVITFSDGSSIQGKIGLNERVQVITDGDVYRGTIVDVTIDDIWVEDCRLIRSLGKHDAELSRLSHARHHIDEMPQEFTFNRADIERVEQVKLDGLRTASRSVFWTVTGVVSAFLLSEKS